VPSQQKFNSYFNGGDILYVCGIVGVINDGGILYICGIIGIINGPKSRFLRLL